jgi:hypothetical protein
MSLNHAERCIEKILVVELFLAMAQRPGRKRSGTHRSEPVSGSHEIPRPSRETTPEHRS